MTFVFLRHVAEAHEMASNSGVATLRNFCWAVGPQKCLLGSSPNPQDFGTKCPKVPDAYAYCLRPGLSLRGLIFPPVRVAEQMVNVRLDRHGLPHIRLGLAVLCIKGLFLFRQLPAGLFHIRYFGKFLPV